MVEQNKILENITKQNTTGQNKTEEKWEDLDPEVQEGLRRYFVKQIQEALKNNRYDLTTLRIIYYNDSAQKTPAVRKNVRGMNAPITNNATIIPIGFSSGIVGFSWPDVLQNAVIRCIALLFQEKHFR